MSEVRMGLKEAADLLGMKPNGVRSRFLSHKIKGERDNRGKIWVWLDPQAANDERNASNPSEPSNVTYETKTVEPAKDFEIKALQAHLEAVSQQLFRANAELDDLRPKAAQATRLEAENEGLRGQLDIRVEQLAELRRLMAEAQTKNEAELRRWMESAPTKGFFVRLFSRS